MNLTQIKGNTWVLEGQEFIPLYRLDERRCVLLDNGLVQEQKELEESLKGAGLLAAQAVSSLGHVFIHIFIAHSRFVVADALPVQSLIKAQVGHDCGYDLIIP